MKSRDNPCRECERRTATCRIDCPEWAEYETKRNADYAKHDPEADYAQYRIGILNRIRRKLARHRRH